MCSMLAAQNKPWCERTMHLFLSQEEALFQWLGLAGFMGKHQSPLHLTDTYMSPQRGPDKCPMNGSCEQILAKEQQAESRLTDQIFTEPQSTTALW